MAEVVKFYVKTNDNNRVNSHIYVNTETSIDEIKTLCGRSISHPYKNIYYVDDCHVCKTCSRIDDRDFSDIAYKSNREQWIKYLPSAEKEIYYRYQSTELEQKVKEEISSLNFYHSEINDMYKLSSAKKDCPICLNEIQPNNLIILSCGHSFGLDCVKKKYISNCPLCRKYLTNDEFKYINHIS